MKQSKRKTHVLALVALGICLASCDGFDWEPEPWALGKQSIVKYTGDSVPLNSARADDFTCFDKDNIAALKSAIDQVNGKRVKKTSDSVFSSLNQRVLQSRFLAK